jgi:hypothetical protein
MQEDERRPVVRPARQDERFSLTGRHAMLPSILRPKLEEFAITLCDPLRTVVGPIKAAHRSCVQDCAYQAENRGGGAERTDRNHFDVGMSAVVDRLHPQSGPIIARRLRSREEMADNSIRRLLADGVRLNDA